MNIEINPRSTIPKMVKIESWPIEQAVIFRGLSMKNLSFKLDTILEASTEIRFQWKSCIESLDLVPLVKNCSNSDSLRLCQNIHLEINCPAVEHTKAVIAKNETDCIIKRLPLEYPGERIVSFLKDFILPERFSRPDISVDNPMKLIKNT